MPGVARARTTDLVDSLARLRRSPPRERVLAAAATPIDGRRPRSVHAAGREHDRLVAAGPDAHEATRGRPVKSSMKRT